MTIYASWPDRYGHKPEHPSSRVTRDRLNRLETLCDAVLTAWNRRAFFDETHNRELDQALRRLRYYLNTGQELPLQEKK